MKILIQKLDPSAKLPKYAYKGDAGMDLFSCANCEIKPNQKAIVPTGLKIAIPKGYGGFVWDKSGLAAKNHITTMAGVLDSNYRGELKVVLANLGSEVYKINSGDKIAQLVVKPIVEAQVVEVQEIGDETERGKGGFGSSGLT